MRGSKTRSSERQFFSTPEVKRAAEDLWSLLRSVRSYFPYLREGFEIFEEKWESGNMSEMLLLGILREFFSLENFSSQEKERVAEKARILTNCLVKEGKKPYVYVCFAEEFGMMSRVVDHLRKVGLSKAADPKLIKVALETDDGAFAQAIISDYEKLDRRKTTVDVEMAYSQGLVKREAEIIRNLANRYRAKVRQVEPRGGMNLATMNAAMEIQKLDRYDLVVPILNGGAGLGNLLEVAGANTRYIETHKTWSRMPLWRKKTGINVLQPTQANQVLIVEDDAYTGETLEGVMPLVEKLQPKEVDVCFSGDLFYEKSVQVAEGMQRFDHVFSTMDFGLDNLIPNLSKLRSRIESILSELEEKKAA